MLCHIRGKLRKRSFIRVTDVVLISLRDYEDNKADIFHKYTEDEIQTLKQMKELPESVTTRTSDIANRKYTMQFMDDVYDDEEEPIQDFRGELSPSDEESGIRKTVILGQNFRKVP
ncbi:hypothetical protein GEMRC1_005950 [Eukaryota sp. GEM-RC1]